MNFYDVFVLSSNGIGEILPCSRAQLFHNNFKSRSSETRTAASCCVSHEVVNSIYSLSTYLLRHGGPLVTVVANNNVFSHSLISGRRSRVTCNVNSRQHENGMENGMENGIENGMLVSERNN